MKIKFEKELDEIQESFIKQIHAKYKVLKEDFVKKQNENFKAQKEIVILHRDIVLLQEEAEKKMLHIQRIENTFFGREVFSLEVNPAQFQKVMDQFDIISQGHTAYYDNTNEEDAKMQTY